MKDFLHQLLHSSSKHAIDWLQQLLEVLHPQLQPAAAAELAAWLAQQRQVVQALTADDPQLRVLRMLLKRSVQHAAVLLLLLRVVVAAKQQQQQQGEAAAAQKSDTAAMTASGATHSSSSSSNDSFVRELLLDVLATQSAGDALSALLQSVQLPPGLLQGAAKVAVHPSKAAAVAQWLPQLLQLGLPPHVKVGHGVVCYAALCCAAPVV